MKHYYKIVDLWVQGCILWAFIFSYIIDGPLIEIMFYVVAGWFFISAIIHAYITTGRYEKFYYVIAVVSYATVAGWPAAFLFPPLFWVLVFILVYIIPLLALAYFTLCILELRYLKIITTIVQP